MLDVGALYTEHHGAIVRYLSRQTRGNVSLAEDLAQETFVRAQRAADTYEDRGAPISAWLYRIARNLLTDHVRKAVKTPAVQLFDSHASQVVTRDTTGQIANVIDLTRYLGRLTPQQRAVLEHRYLQGCSTRDTAEATGNTEAGVKKLQARALVNMRRMLEAA